MISWIWIIPAIWFGAIIGFLAAALMATGGDANGE